MPILVGIEFCAVLLQDVLVGGDVSREEDVVRLVREAVEGLGGLDILVNNAGIQISRPSDELSGADFDRVLAVNLRGIFLGIKYAAPAMRARGGGSIINTASVHGMATSTGIAAYAASKHGVIGLTRALAAELGSQGYHGITVNAICPGYVRAGMGIKTQSTKAGPMSGSEIFDRYYRRQVPLRRMMEAEEIGHAAVFLALPASAGITGQALNVDGGFVMS